MNTTLRGALVYVLILSWEWA